MGLLLLVLPSHSTQTPFGLKLPGAPEGNSSFGFSGSQVKYLFQLKQFSTTKIFVERLVKQTVANIKISKYIWEYSSQIIFIFVFAVKFVNDNINFCICLIFAF